MLMGGWGLGGLIEDGGGIVFLWTILWMLDLVWER